MSRKKDLLKNSVAYMKVTEEMLQQVQRDGQATRAKVQEYLAARDSLAFAITTEALVLR